MQLTCFHHCRSNVNTKACEIQDPFRWVFSHSSRLARGMLVCLLLGWSRVQTEKSQHVLNALQCREIPNKTECQKNTMLSHRVVSDSRCFLFEGRAPLCPLCSAGHMKQHCTRPCGISG